MAVYPTDVDPYKCVLHSCVCSEVHIIIRVAFGNNVASVFDACDYPGSHRQLLQIMCYGLLFQRQFKPEILISDEVEHLCPV